MLKGKVVFPALFLLAVGILLSGCDLIPTVEIANCTVTVADLQLDEIELGKIEVFLQGEGAETVVIAIGSEEYTAEVEERKAVIYCGWSECVIERVAEQDSFTIEVTALSSSGNVLASRSFEKSISIVDIGETIPNVGQEILLKLLWWKESEIAVNGPYSSGFYTFTAKPGRGFVILAYRFKNNGIRPEDTPYLSGGEILTSKGYIYPLWSPPGGIWAEEYSPRESTAQEIQDLIGDSGGYEELLPEETVVGCVVFEIPEDEQPREIKLFKVFPIISLS